MNIGGTAQDRCWGQLGGRPGSDSVAEIDEIVGDDPEPDPALHSIVAGIPASVETVATFAYSDAALTPGARAPTTVLPLALAMGEFRGRRRFVATSV